MTSERKKLGDWGESVAALHLEAKGYQIVERNWHDQLGEIDIVAKEEGLYVFVEVKTRRGRAKGTPEEGLTDRKAERLLDLSEIYIAEHDLDTDWRIDLVAIELDETGKLVRLEHIPNAVLGW